MTPDQHDLIDDALTTLKNHDALDTVEDLLLLIEHARETLEQVIFIEEDEGGSYHAKRKHFTHD